MKITVERTGGFAGLTENLGSLDTEWLGPAKRKAVEERVRSIGFFKLPEQVSGGQVGADFQTYRVTVADGPTQQRTVTFTGDAPDSQPLQELIKIVTG
jgi:hypothetical protein